jgi:arylsulfatase A-like enzyme
LDQNPEDERPGPSKLAATALVVVVWLTAALAVAGYASGDRYPGYFMIWTAALLAGGLVVPLVALGALGRRAGRTAALASAYCVLFAAAVSLDVAPDLRVKTRLGAARLLLLVAALALAAWNVKRRRGSRLGLGAAMALLCLGWVGSGLLRSPGVPDSISRPAILLPLALAIVVLLPGVPRLDPLLSRVPRWNTLLAAAALVLLPLQTRTLLPSLLAAPAAAKAAPADRSAVLIVLDTLRRDHMSLYGYARKTTPSLDERAKTAVVFDQSTAVSPWTLPSHASMFTGLWPRSHGADSFRGENDEPDNVRPLPPGSLTLAEIARDHGYRTAGFAANAAYLTSHWGMDQGFQEYLCRRPRPSELMLGKARMLGRKWDERRAQHEEMAYFTAPEITRAAIAWLEQHRDAPFFLFLNYLDAHTPNAAPGSQGLPFEDETPERKGSVTRYLSGTPLTPGEQRGIVNEYDREVVYLDRWVGALLDHLASSGLDDKTMVVLTSDHGEYLGEHHLLGHRWDLHAEVVDVPLVVWEPGATPGRSARPAQSHDVFPTILRYLGLPVPEGTQGQPLMDVDHPTVSELSYAIHDMLPPEVGKRFDRTLRTIRVGDHRYFNGTNGDERLFHRGDDPREANNLVAELPDVAASGRAMLEAWLFATPPASAPAQPAEKLDPKALDNLRALGYVR